MSPARAIPFLFLAALALPADGGEPHPRDILVTRQLATARGLKVGDEVLLSSDPRGTNPRPFRIAALYEPVPDPALLAQDRFEARLHLDDLLGLTTDSRDPLAHESVATIQLKLKDPTAAEPLRSAFAARIPGAASVRTGEDGESARLFLVLERFHLAIAIVTVTGSTAFLLALMVMRADERREIAGILRLVGFTRGRVLSQALLEGMVVAGLGAVLGIAFAGLTEGLVNAFFQWYYDTTLVFVRVSPGIALRCVAVSVPAGVLAGFVASWAILRHDIVGMLRR